MTACGLHKPHFKKTNAELSGAKTMCHGHHTSGENVIWSDESFFTIILNKWASECLWTVQA